MARCCCELPLSGGGQEQSRAMWYFLVGAALCMLLMIVRAEGGPAGYFRRPYSIDGLFTAACVGALVYGSVLWVIGTFVVS